MLDGCGVFLCEITIYGLTKTPWAVDRMDFDFRIEFEKVSHKRLSKLKYYGMKNSPINLIQQ